jgi:hypothetical protein
MAVGVPEANMRARKPGSHRDRHSRTKGNSDEIASKNISHKTHGSVVGDVLAVR